MKVQDVMNDRVYACHPQDPMAHAARIFWERDCGCVPVTNDDEQVVGILTDRDVCMAAYTQGRTLDTMAIATAMATNVHVCRPTDTVAAAEKTMRTHLVRRLPVIDDERRLVGIISLSDIAQEAARERKQTRKHVTDIEVAETLSSVCTPRTPAPTAAT